MLSLDNPCTLESPSLSRANFIALQAPSLSCDNLITLQSPANPVTTFYLAIYNPIP